MEWHLIKKDGFNDEMIYEMDHIYMNCGYEIK